MSETHRVDTVECDCNNPQSELIKPITTTEARPRPLFLRRNIVAFFLFFGSVNLYTIRSNTSVAVVDMTSNRTYYDGDSVTYKQDYDWDSVERGLVHSSFSIGQLIFSIAGGWLGTKFGGAKVIGLCMLAAAIFTLITPIFNSQIVYPMVFIRILTGMAQVAAINSVPEMWARWYPVDEQARQVAIGIFGSYIGSATSYAISGYLAKNWRWPSIFYVTGAFGLLVSFLWLRWMRDSPAADPWISEYELEYLNRNIITQKKTKTNYPWMKLLISKPIIALYVMQWAAGFDTQFLRVILPIYLNDVLHYDIKNTGFLSALAILPGILSVLLVGSVKDYVQNKQWLTQTQTTKTVIFIGSTVSSLIYIWAAFSTSSLTILLSLLLLPFFSSLNLVPLLANMVELSHEYPSVICGIGGSFNTIAQLLGPLFVGFVVVSQEALQWRTVLCTFAAVEICCMIVYLKFGSSKAMNLSRSEKTSRTDK